MIISNFKFQISKFFLLVLFIFLLAAKPSFAQEKKVTTYFFYGQGCPHCAKEEKFLNSLEKKYDFLEVKRYEIYYDAKNAKNLEKIGKEMKIDVSGVPIIIIGEEAISGYLNDQTTGAKIEAIIKNHYQRDYCPDIVGNIICQEKPNGTQESIVKKDTEITLPIFGQIDTKSFSLPVLTLVVGALDGFNPCAMWILLFLISLLLGMKDRKKMWLLGSAFIFTSGLVYFLSLAAWLNLFLFLGFIVWIRIIIGMVAVGSGAYNLKEFFYNKEGGCTTVGDEKREKIFNKIKSITKEKSFILALLGMVILAAAVSLIELVCSAGLPAIYTQVLSLAKLPVWQYYLYLLFYILIYMLDDMLVFIIAMITLQAVGISRKYVRLSNLIGGIIILLLGIFLIFKPEVLMFG